MKIQHKVLCLFLYMLLSICLCACTEKDQTGNIDGSGASENQSEIQKEESEETSNQETTAEQAVNVQSPYSEDMDWLDYVISCATDVDIDEITDEIYQSVVEICVQLVHKTHSGAAEYDMIVYFDNRERYQMKEGQNGFSFPDVISIRNPKKYTGLRSFDFTNQLSDDLSDFHAVDWNSICQLTSLKHLDIQYYYEMDHYYRGKKTFTKIEDLSCFSKLEKLEHLYLAGIELPTDISDLFFIRDVIDLEGCNITDASFENMDCFQTMPTQLYLSWNNIKDARKIIAQVKTDGTGIQHLSLVGNPLEKIGNPDSIDNIEFDEETCIRLGLDKKYTDYYFWNFCVD